MTPDLHIRPADRGDRAALLELFAELNRHHETIQPDYFREAAGLPPVMQALERRPERQDLALLVADLDAALLGFVVIRIHETPNDPLLVPRRRAHVEDMLVTATARRQGVGRALVQEATRWSQERGAGRVLLTVWQGNQGAEAFYRSLGFRTLNRVMELV